MNRAALVHRASFDERLREDWIDQLYVLPGAQGTGVGTALLGIAKSQARSLSLWTFQRNDAARGFYEKRGFIVTKVTDGSENEEREPDVLYSWVASEEAMR
jgi:putative acetyltransferase